MWHSATKSPNPLATWDGGGITFRVPLNPWLATAPGIRCWSPSSCTTPSWRTPRAAPRSPRPRPRPLPRCACRPRAAHRPRDWLIQRRTSSLRRLQAPPSLAVSTRVVGSPGTAPELEPRFCRTLRWGQAGPAGCPDPPENEEHGWWTTLNNNPPTSQLIQAVLTFSCCYRLVWLCFLVGMWLMHHSPLTSRIAMFFFCSTPCIHASVHHASP